jgi:peptide/nickel transport system permease protein
MLRYSVSRLWQAGLTVFVLLTFTFAVVRFTGDPTARLLPEDATPTDRAEMRADLHLDDPLWQQFGVYLGNVAQGQMGRSYKWRIAVSELLVDRMPVTITLALLAGGLTIFIGVPLGIVAARRRGTWIDQVILMIALLGQSVPIFVTALAGILLFSVELRWLPVAGVDRPSGYVLPALTLGWFGVATLIRVTRVSMLNVLGSEYIVTARAKGLRQRAIIYTHALRNALIPIVTIFGLILATLLTGTIVTETMFGLPGIGRLAVESIINRDFPVVQGFVIFATLVFVGINLLVDLIYGLIDPRTRTGTR